MRWSGTDRDDSEPWFEIGQLKVNTTILVAVVWAVTLLIYTAEGRGGPVNTHLLLAKDSVVESGQVWRLVTWPWAHLDFSLGNIIAIALFVYFGLDLERQTGRRAFAVLIGSSIVIIGVVATLLGTLLSRDFFLYDIELLELTVVLLFCAEAPTRLFFFGIPAWVIAAVIVALELINDIADRDWVRLLTVVVAAGLISLIARRVGLLSMYDRVPELHLPKRKRKGESSGPRPSTSPRRRPAGPSGDAGKRPGSLWGKRKESEEAEIVPMPPQRPRIVNTSAPDMSADDLALDVLLDKIADGGLDALTPRERQELDELRARRRGPQS